MPPPTIGKTDHAIVCSMTRHASHHQYLWLITDCDREVHSQWNVVDGKSQPSSTGDTGKARACPGDSSASAGLPENHFQGRVLSLLSCALQRHVDIVSVTVKLQMCKFGKKKGTIFAVLITYLRQQSAVSGHALDLHAKNSPKCGKFSFTDRGRPQEEGLG